MANIDLQVIVHFQEFHERSEETKKKKSKIYITREVPLRTLIHISFNPARSYGLLMCSLQEALKHMERRDCCHLVVAAPHQV